MKTYIFWNGKYNGIVGGGLWDQYLVNARRGYGTLTLIDGVSVADAKSRLKQATLVSGVYVHGDQAKKIAER